jgi:hypothetical protein
VGEAPRDDAAIPEFPPLRGFRDRLTLLLSESVTIGQPQTDTCEIYLGLKSYMVKRGEARARAANPRLVEDRAKMLKRLTIS